MRERVVLAYAGGLASSVAIAWLTETEGLDVITVTLDIGQGRDLAELRARALACGAVRAHAIDARDDFAREVLLPSLYTQRDNLRQAAMASLPRPFIATKLVDIAGLEGAPLVAHGSQDTAFDAEVHAIAPTLRVLAPARSWNMTIDELIAYARQRSMPVGVLRDGAYRIDQHLWGRTLTWDGEREPPRLTRQLDEAALVDIHFDQGVPTSINGVPMSPAELIECLSLIAEQHGIGRLDVGGGALRVLVDAPAAVVLQAAARAAGGPGTSDVCLKLDEGRFTVIAPQDRQSALVNYA
ncbi:MAG TPA: argininosuccinate synthase domain-containing protein [Vicinamibacterales bacterium]|nr:argininosuccinate synthase domain-containing protein [Vicinamibacterales bacterium]